MVDRGMVKEGVGKRGRKTIEMGGEFGGGEWVV